MKSNLKKFNMKNSFQSKNQKDSHMSVNSPAFSYKEKKRVNVLAHCFLYYHKGESEMSLEFLQSGSVSTSKQFV